MYSFINNATPNRPKSVNLFTQPTAPLTTTTIGYKMKTNRSSNLFSSMIEKIGNGATKCGSCGGH